MIKKTMQRPVADKTRAAILKAARKLFAENGFSGTSTLAIAKAAKVNETLLFHHFGNKQQLWQLVKSSIVESLKLMPLCQKPVSLRAFLEEIFYQRLQAFQQKPELARLIRWQSLEKKADKLIAGNALAPSNWLPIIIYLQETGKMNAHLQPEFIMIWLTASINTLIFDHIPALNAESSHQEYISFLLNGFDAVLK